MLDIIRADCGAFFLFLVSGFFFLAVDVLFLCRTKKKNQKEKQGVLSHGLSDFLALFEFTVQVV